MRKKNSSALKRDLRINIVIYHRELCTLDAVIFVWWCKLGGQTVKRSNKTLLTFSIKVCCVLVSITSKT